MAHRLRTLTRVNKRLLAALICAVGAVACGWLYIHDVELGLRGGRKVMLLAAARELAPGTRLT